VLDISSSGFGFLDQTVATEKPVNIIRRILNQLSHTLQAANFGLYVDILLVPL
jgi:hypothetical protein